MPKIKIVKILISNSFHFINVLNAFRNLWNIVLKDAVSKIGSNNISLSVRDNSQMQETLYYYAKYKELSKVLHL